MTTPAPVTPAGELDPWSDEIEPSDDVIETSAFPSDAPTNETSWLEFLDPLPALDVSGLASVLVVAPHPDDETLACGGLIADLCRRGASVRVVSVTDGEASHPGSPGLVDIRRQEQSRALTELGVDAPALRLCLPDGAVADHLGTLVDRLRAQCRTVDAILAPWAHDGHTDHDACGFAAAEAAGDTGGRVLAYPVWAWQWATPADLAPLPLRRWDMSDRASAAKAAAMQSFVSQTTDILGETIVDGAALGRFRRPFEVFADGS